MNIVPTNPGITKLISHINNVAAKIPNTFCEKAENKNTAIEPLSPSSVIAIVGTTDMMKSIIIIKIIALE